MSDVARIRLYYEVNFFPIGFNKLMVSQVIDKKTKQLILVMLPKWVALLGMIVLMIKLMQLKRVIIGML